VLLAGGVALLWAGIWWLLTREVRRAPLFHEPDVEVWWHVLRPITAADIRFGGDSTSCSTPSIR